MTRHRNFYLFIGLTLLIVGQACLLILPENLILGLIPITAGAVGLVLARRIDPPPTGWQRSGVRGRAATTPPAPTNGNNHTLPPMLTFNGLAWIGLGAALSFVTGLFAHRRPLIFTYEFLFVLWGLGIACLLIGSLRPGELRERWEAFTATFWSEAGWRSAVLLLTLIALAARLYELDAHPYPFSFDEASFARESAALADGGFRASPFEPAWFSHPRLYFFLIALGVRWLGRTVIAARLPSAIFGALTIPAVYALGRESFDRWVGLVAAIFLAGFQFHVHFSRLAINNVIDPMWGTLAFFYLLRGLRTRGGLEFALAGVTLGLAQYFYAGSRLLPVIALIFLLIIWITRPRLFRSRFPGLILTLAGLLIVTWPANWFYLVEGQPLTERLAATSLWDTGQFAAMAQSRGVAGAIWEQIRPAFLALIHTLDESGFYGPIAPVMGWFAGVPFMVGIIYLIFPGQKRPGNSAPCKGGRRRDASSGGNSPRPYHTLPLIWITLTIIAGSVLLTHPPQYPRYVLLTPAAALVVGLGLVETLRMLIPVKPGRQSARRVLRRIVMIMVGLGLAAADLLFYALIYSPAPAYAHDPYTLLGDGVGRLVGEVAAENPAVRVYYLVEPEMRLNGTSLIEYFAPGVNDQRVDRILPNDFEPGDEALFILSARRSRELGTLVEAYPGGSAWRLRDREGRLVFVSYRVRFDDDDGP